MYSGGSNYSELIQAIDNDDEPFNQLVKRLLNEYYNLTKYAKTPLTRAGFCVFTQAIQNADRQENAHRQHDTL